MKKKIVAGTEDIGQRLDKFLLSRFSQYSRAFLKEQIKQGNIFIHPVRSRPTKPDIYQPKPQAKSLHKTGAKIKHERTSAGVNGVMVKPSYLLREGDEILFMLPDKPENKLTPNPDIKLSVIYEDNNVLVIDKPAGISVHPRMDKVLQPVPAETQNTLVSGLIAYCPELASVGDNPLARPGLVHRLDKDTSGVMIIAKNQAAFTWLKNQFQKRLTAKKYLALVHGHLKETNGQIKCFLKRSPDPTKQQVASEGREAISDYKVLKEFKDYSLVEARPKTGRFHQIRVQLAYLGHPVVGDTKYGGGRQKPTNLTRQFLHAVELEITLPDGQKRLFASPLPADLNKVIEALEKILN
ncbi:MAG TPA: hypothetical protein DHI91_00455 [Candidatus Portnoybacteria bacterium]|uniref:Pseudouridine synthase n=1 Tax=Candidatus Portnoybacteria bacterium CG02_land_8_20_14_3_00_45_8 TaxID=1974807 RepID=A0A2M7D5Y1_9BACT|nr:MAG: hypothetical protein COS30_02120 [Candidatus Portnoybacteria bacterium CG02_land_8_20_14_3_00_45_8]HCX27597.1 hypothetical protein [Candidatus Portnoybacteria bacterium]